MNLFDKDNLILKEIIKLNYKASLVIAGGGTSAISSLLLIPGASNFILEAHIPYSKKSLERYLDCEIKTTCNTLVSIQLAKTAKKRADFLNHEKKNTILVFLVLQHLKQIELEWVTTELIFQFLLIKRFFISILDLKLLRV